MLKKILLTVLSFIVVVAVLAAMLLLPVSAEESSGTCSADGDRLSWTLNQNTGVLLVSGKGKWPITRKTAHRGWKICVISARSSSAKA